MPKIKSPVIKPPRVLPYGDSALLVQYESESFSRNISRAIHSLSAALSQHAHWTERVSGYDSLLCVFDMNKISIDAAKHELENTIIHNKTMPHIRGKVIDIPVTYGGEFGPDMKAIIKTSGLSESEIIDVHSAEPYLVCMMGFIPGFAFLSDVPSVLQHPRHATPRAHVPAGSIGIAGWQTGIYGLDSPGGWQIIGRTPLKLFDKNRDKPFLIEAGDSLRFIPSDSEIFE